MGNRRGIERSAPYETPAITQVTLTKQRLHKWTHWHCLRYQHANHLSTDVQLHTPDSQTPTSAYEYLQTLHVDIVRSIGAGNADIDDLTPRLAH